MDLTVKAEELENSRVALDISVDAEECTAAFERTVKELTKRAKIDGFRKGGAPRQLIINHYGKETITASACEDVIENGVQKAIKQAGLNAIGQAVLDEDAGNIDSVIAGFQVGSPLNFRVKVDVWPTAKLTASYDGLQVTAEKVPVSDEVIESALQDLRSKESFTVIAPEGAKAEIGNVVVADMVGYYRNDDNSKGEPLPDVASGEKLEIRMQEDQYMEGFVEGLVGAGVGETKTVNVQFPNSSAKPELAGQKAVFDITVHAISETVLPELDDELARRAGADNIAALRDQVRDRLSQEADMTTEANVNRAIEDALAEITDVTLPETMVEERVKTKFANMLSDFRAKGFSEDQVKAMVSKENYELYKTRALGRVQRELTVNFSYTVIAKELGVKADEKEIEDQMALVKAELKGEEVEEERIRDQVEAQLERGLVLEHLRKTAQITYTEKEAAPETQVPAAA